MAPELDCVAVGTGRLPQGSVMRTTKPRKVWHVHVEPHGTSVPHMPALTMHAQPVKDAWLPLYLPQSGMTSQCLMHACLGGQPMAFLLGRHTTQRMPSQHSSFQGLAASPAHRLG